MKNLQLETIKPKYMIELIESLYDKTKVNPDDHNVEFNDDGTIKVSYDLVMNFIHTKWPGNEYLQHIRTLSGGCCGDCGSDPISGFRGGFASSFTRKDGDFQIASICKHQEKKHETQFNDFKYVFCFFFKLINLRIFVIYLVEN